MHRKWPEVRPTFFPFPALVLTVLALAVRTRWLLPAVALLPQALYPAGLRTAVAGRDPRCLADPYLQLMQEAADNVGFLEGLLRSRRIVPEGDHVARRELGG